MAYRKTNRKAKKTQKDYDMEFNQKLIELMKSGKKPWQKPWHSIGYQNFLSGHIYTGSNPMICSVDCMLKGYKSPYFLSSYQAKKEFGWYPTKGSKATYLVVGATGRKTVEVENEETGEKEEQTQFFGFRKWTPVFNLDTLNDEYSDIKKQDVLEKKKSKVNVLSESERIDSAEEFITAQNAVIQYGGDRACYLPATDSIHLPNFHTFRSATTFYGTAIHELGHWTSHPTRCDRKLGRTFGDSDYAFEELVAELTAAYVCNDLGIDPEIEHHASYLKNWLEKFQEDYKYFWKASSLARKAADFLRANAGLLIETDEMDAA